VRAALLAAIEAARDRGRELGADPDSTTGAGSAEGPDAAADGRR